MNFTSNENPPDEISRPVRIAAGHVTLPGELRIPPGAAGVVVFAHGSGSSRHSPRNQSVARALCAAGTATLLFDLLTRDEEIQESRTRHLRFNIALLAGRLVDATRWLAGQPEAALRSVGYFGASTGGAAALMAAAELGPAIHAVVSRGGRPDLAGEALSRVESPTLLIVGERDDFVLELNKTAFAQLRCPKELNIVQGATHLFEEPGALEDVSRLAAAWFRRYLKTR